MSYRLASRRPQWCSRQLPRRCGK